jgi:thiamine-phosphate pyrophosphorylase
MQHSATRAEPEPGDVRRARLEAARLYLIVDAAPHGRPAIEFVEAALDGGVDMVQLRDKEADDSRVLETARSLLALCQPRNAILILNDRPDLALDAGCDGVHLGQRDAPVEEARALLGGDFVIGLSTHSPEQIRAARASSADYIGVGPVHKTPTKPGARPVGLELVEHAARRAGKPFFAIGGIDRGNVGTVLAAGARRVAVVRAIRDAADPRAAARELRAAVEEGAGAGAAL